MTALMVMAPAFHASSLLWLGFPFVALWAMYLTESQRTRLAMAIVLVFFLVTASVWAIQIVDPCSVPPLSELSWWERWLLGCF